MKSQCPVHHVLKGSLEVLLGFTIEVSEEVGAVGGWFRAKELKEKKGILPLLWVSLAIGLCHNGCCCGVLTCLVGVIQRWVLREGTVDSVGLGLFCLSCLAWLAGLQTGFETGAVSVTVILQVLRG